MEQPIVDTHVHFWDPDQLEYPWLEDVPGLNNAFLPEDYQNSSVTVNVEKIVFVECDCAPGARLDEVAWVTALAKNETRIQGIVASAPLETGEVAQGHLEELAANPLVKGIRRLLEEAAVDFCIQPGFVRGVQLLADLNFSFDICITHVQLANTINLVKQCPDVQFVLDHIGKPDIKSERFEPWRAEIKTLSQVPNVSCKISGLVTEADWENWTRTDLKPYIDHIIDSFGTDRVMYGGDWPVSSLATTYADWVEALDWATESLTTEERHKLFYHNASAFYRLD